MLLVTGPRATPCQPPGALKTPFPGTASKRGPHGRPAALPASVMSSGPSFPPTSLGSRPGPVPAPNLSLPRRAVRPPPGAPVTAGPADVNPVFSGPSTNASSPKPSPPLSNGMDGVGRDAPRPSGGLHFFEKQGATCPRHLLFLTGWAESQESGSHSTSLNSGLF